MSANPYFNTTRMAEPLTRESFEEAVAAFVRHDDAMQRGKADRIREVNARIRREGPPGPLQRRVDRHFIDCGPAIMSPAQADALIEALRVEHEGDG